MAVRMKLANQWLNAPSGVGCERQMCASVATGFSGQLVSPISHCTTKWGLFLFPESLMEWTLHWRCQHWPCHELCLQTKHSWRRNTLSDRHAWPSQAFLGSLQVKHYRQALPFLLHLPNRIHSPGNNLRRSRNADLVRIKLPLMDRKMGN